MHEAIPIDTRAGFRQAILEAVTAARELQAREMWWLDASFVEWPLDEPSLLDELQAWLRLPMRRLQLFAHDFDALSRTHPRFVQWRRHWSHVVHGRQPLDLEPASIESLLLTDAGTLVTLSDPSRFRGLCCDGGPRVGEARARVDAIAQRSQEAFTTVVLGI